MRYVMIVALVALVACGIKKPLVYAKQQNMFISNYINLLII
ncbi:hypothetical protein IHI24_000308 [Rickettsia endosymbiont of Cardiosporidium cionae]|nr:hypothetical protein IHI24_000308 [Rickettsia endosymbiont of Cardiosporidium cionae]